MDRLSRRELLASLAATLAGCGASPSAPPDDPVDAGDFANDAAVPDDADVGPTVEVRFEHGVASGDPLSDRVILWTRATPQAPTVPGDKALLRWELASTPDFTEVVARGSLVADARRDWTAKVDVSGLRPGSVWYYRFRSGDAVSPIGRTRTAPVERVSRLRLAAVSCASLAHGYFHVYRDIAARADLDLVLHLGDYIYEYPSNYFGDVRAYDPPTELFTLSDYRRRYAQYRRDPDLQAMHRQHPMAAVWDDHEFSNNSFRDGTDGVPDPRFRARAEAARRAWFEWMPTRESRGPWIYRRLRYGPLADVTLLDTRYDGRDAQKPYETPRLRDPSRSLLGMTQEAWLAAQLADGGAQWRVLAQQVILSPRPNDLNVDAWDGYPAARDRLFAALRLPGVGDPVVLTGDVHTSWAFDVTPDPRDPRRYDPRTGAGSLGVELVTPGVSAPSLLNMGEFEEERMRNSLQHLRFVDLTRRGWVLVDLTEARMQAVWNLLDDGTVERGDRTLTPRVAAVLESRAGARHLVQTQTADPPPDDPPPLAP
ncbi:MAG: alkaline phosphatase D family protein [Polyangiales bacterium]